MKYYDERQYTIIKGVLENLNMSDEDITSTIMEGEKNNTPYFNLINDAASNYDSDKVTDAITTWNSEAKDASYQFRMDDPNQSPNSSTAQYQVNSYDSSSNNATSSSQTAGVNSSIVSSQTIESGNNNSTKYSDEQKQIIKDITNRYYTGQNEPNLEEKIEKEIIPYGEEHGLSVEELLNNEEFYSNHEELEDVKDVYFFNNAYDEKEEEQLNAKFTAKPSASSSSSSDSESLNGASEEELPEIQFSFDDCNLKISDTPLDGNYNTNDIERLIKDFNSLLAFVSEDGTIRSLSKELEGLYDEIKDETKNRLVNVISDGAYLKNKIDDLAKLWEDYIMSLINKLKEANSQFGSSDGLREGLYGGSNGTINIGGINSSNSNSSNNVTTPSTVILSAIGTLTFTAITPLYETLGSQSTIQASLTDKYDVVGIYLNNDKYFYKIYDNKLNKYYYAEINGNSILSTDYMQLLKMNEESMMLTSTKIGDNVLTKYTDPNQVYAVKGTIEEGGINFAAIHDTNDDKDYYVALSSSNELVDTSKFITENSGVLAEKTTPESSEIEVVG